MYLDAPHLLPMTSVAEVDGAEVEVTNGGRENARAWFLYSDDDPADATGALDGTPTEYVGLRRSVDLVGECLLRMRRNDHGDDDDRDFCAILGFSQGATFGHVLSAMAASSLASPRGRGNDDGDDDGDPGASLSSSSSSRSNPFGRICCAILIGGFPSMHRARSSPSSSSSSSSNRDDAVVGVATTTDGDDGYGGKIDLKSLHVHGEKDTSVPISYGRRLADRFVDPRTYVHGGGHSIPHNGVLCERVIEFLDNCHGGGVGGGVRGGDRSRGEC